MAKKANGKFYGTGRRKSSIARVYLVPGTGNILSLIHISEPTRH